jgi:hypothetical protein
MSLKSAGVAVTVNGVVVTVDVVVVSGIVGGAVIGTLLPFGFFFLLLILVPLGLVSIGGERISGTVLSQGGIGRPLTETKGKTCV